MKTRYRAMAAPGGLVHPSVHRGGTACWMLALALIALLSPLTAGEAASSRSTPLTLSAKTITIRTGFRCDHCQNYPYNLVTAGGHYLLDPYRQRGRLYLVYDGRVLRGLDNFYTIPVMALSQNGLHYAYAVESDGLYVDGHARSGPGHITGLAISNDGRHVYYGADHIPGYAYLAGVLVRDGKPIAWRAAGLQATTRAATEDIIPTSTEDSTRENARSTSPTRGTLWWTVVRGCWTAGRLDYRPGSAATRLTLTTGWSTSTGP